MPIQVYSCPEHGEFELRLSFKDDVQTAGICPTCGKRGMWKPSAARFMLLDRATMRKHAYPKEHNIP
jgi:ssDNA-binding Zn-finger/Zn-ribbon topoisomerase 1